MSTPVPSIAVLGVSALYHDAAAVLIIDGRIVAAAQEERFTRNKGTADLPVNAIEFVLRAGGLRADQLSAVAYYESPTAKLDRLLTTNLTGHAGAARSFTLAMRSWLPNKLWVESHLRDVVGKGVPVVAGDHHLSHAASAFYPSPFERAAVLTIDGVGEWSTTTIARGDGSTIEFVEQIEYPNSIGLLYSAFTLLCGFKVNSGEYKLMGLAPYGTPRFADRILSEVLHLADDGSYSLNPVYFTYLRSDRTYGPAFERLFGVTTRHPDEPITQVHADLAASIQHVTNLVVAGLARRAVERTGQRDLVLAGGVALNVVSIGELERSGIVDRLWVQPAAGDAGGALGAALELSHSRFGVPRRVETTDAMQGAFLGPEPGDDDEIGALLNEYGLASQRHDESSLAELIARAVAGGEIVGLARGRMEFGPRALGARTVLADARDPEMQRRLNLKTKFREGFRPFAPIVLADKAADHFDLADHDSPYMLKTYPVRRDHRLSPASDPSIGAAPPLVRVNEIRSHLPCVTHIDYSARVQTVDVDRNPFLHAVLTRFDELTGTPVMVNTSFNVRGEPIVCTAVDAVECFLATDIDVLVIGDHVVRRDRQDPDRLAPRRVRNWGAD